MSALTREEVEILRNDLKTNYLKKKRVYWKFKRAFDICASLTAIIVLFVPLCIVALLIYIDDPHGSPIFTQDRMGRDGKLFKFYKFRSMVVNAEALLDTLQDKNEKTGPVFKIKNDPRVTRIGKFIRKTSIDELPQLLNILKGDMSVVGPRPALPREVAQYDDYAKLRLLITPGLTCYWQVQNKRDKITFDEWMDMDIRYIKERTFLGDIKLIFQTLKVAVTGQGT